jgi:hypothetical protein
MTTTPNRQPAPHPKNDRDDGDYSPTPGQMMRRFVLCLRGFHLNREKAKVTDWLVVALSLGVAGAAFWSAWIFQGQLTEARRATEIQERPWLSVEVTSENGLVFANATQAVLKLKLSVKNVGHSIAKDIQIDVKMFPTDVGIPIAPDAMQHQKELCDPPKARHMAPFDLFAIEQPAEREMDISAITSAEQLAPVIDGNKTRNFVGFYFVGCVTYHSSFGSEIRQTYFAYHLIRQIPHGNGKFLMLANGMPLMMGFEMGVNAAKGDLSMVQELNARNDAY